MGSEQTWVEAAFQDPELTEDEKALRDCFVAEYLKDYNAIKAAQRIGFMYSFAEEYGPSFLKEAYVQREITAYELKASEDPEQEIHNIVSQLKAQANHYGGDSTHGSRIKALALLLEHYKQEAGVGVEDDRPKGGVMVVPEMLDYDQWSQIAMPSQKKLKETVQD